MIISLQVQVDLTPKKSSKGCQSGCLCIHPNYHENTSMHTITANKNRPSSYGFTEANQRNLLTILD